MECKGQSRHTELDAAADHYHAPVSDSHGVVADVHSHLAHMGMQRRPAVRPRQFLLHTRQALPSLPVGLRGDAGASWALLLRLGLRGCSLSWMQASIGMLVLTLTRVVHITRKLWSRQMTLQSASTTTTTCSNTAGGRSKQMSPDRLACCS